MLKSTFKEFREFLVKQNALALAIGVVAGGAIAKVVSGIVDDVFMPLIGVVLPGGEWRSAQLALSHNPDGAVGNAIKYGDLLGRMVDFAIIALVIFGVTKLFLREKPKEPTTRACPACLEQIPLGATR